MTLNELNSYAEHRLRLAAVNAESVRLKQIAWEKDRPRREQEERARLDAWEAQMAENKAIYAEVQAKERENFIKKYRSHSRTKSVLWVTLGGIIMVPLAVLYSLDTVLDIWYYSYFGIFVSVTARLAVVWRWDDDRVLLEGKYIEKNGKDDVRSHDGRLKMASFILMLILVLGFNWFIKGKYNLEGHSFIFGTLSGFCVVFYYWLSDYSRRIAWLIR